MGRGMGGGWRMEDGKGMERGGGTYNQHGVVRGEAVSMKGVLLVGVLACLGGEMAARVLVGVDLGRGVFCCGA